MKVKKLISVDQFYDQVIVKDKKLTWKCPICNEECRFLNQHLQRKHNIDFFQYFKDNVDYSCQYCGKCKELDDLKWDRLKVSKSSLDHKNCVIDYKNSMVQERYCLVCNKPISSFSKYFCSYECSNIARYSDPKYREKHRKAITDSYNKNPELRRIRAIDAITTGFYKRGSITSLSGENIVLKDDGYYIDRIKEKHKDQDIVWSYLNRLKNENKIALPNNKVSEPEFEMLLELAKLDFNAHYQYKIDRFYYDFYLPEYKLLIEIDGYWHKDNKNKDLMKSVVALKSGYNLVRVSDRSNLHFCLQDQNWVNLNELEESFNVNEIYQEYLIDLNAKIEKYGKSYVDKPKSQTKGKHWKYRQDITKDKIEEFLKSSNKKTITNLLRFFNITNCNVIEKRISEFYGLTYYEFVNRYLYESKIKKNNRI